MTRRQLAPVPVPRPTDRKIWANNPVRFAKYGLGVHPWNKQREILDALAFNQYVAVRSCNGSGKTFTAALATIWWLMAHDEAIVITTAPTERQVKNLLWREIRNFHQNNRELIGGRITQTKLELSNRRFAFGFATNAPERFQGFHHENILIVVDEAAGVHDFVFDAIMGSMTTANAKMLMIGNPTTVAGTFYDAFHKNRSDWVTIHISAFDTPAFTGEIPPDQPLPPGMPTPDWVQRYARQRGEDSFAYQNRVLGDFASEPVDTLIAVRLIEDAAKRTFDNVEQHDPVMGLDIARFGDCQTVAVIRQGPEVLHMSAFRKSDLMETTGRALELARRYNVKQINVDEVGLGGGVVDRLYELREISVTGVNVGKKANNKEDFANLRAEIFDGLKQRFLEGEIAIPDDPELISQLASMAYTFTSGGQLEIESKQHIRRSGRQSPDKADALALAFMKPRPGIMIWQI